MNEVDRCEACEGSGRGTGPHSDAWRASRRADLTVDPRTQSWVRLCEACEGRGALDPVASLVRAIERGQTLAWCTVHAPDGKDPLPGLWERASHETIGRLVVMVAPAYDRVLARSVNGQPGGFREFGRAALEYEALPTLAEVLEAAKEDWGNVR